MTTFKNKKVVTALSVTVLLASVIPAFGQVYIMPQPGYQSTGGYGTPYGGGGGRGRRNRQGQQGQNGNNGYNNGNQAYNNTNNTYQAEPPPKPFTYVPGGNVNPAPVADASGRVYVGTGRRAVYALDKTTGKILWTFRPSGDVTASPAVGPDGTVYVTSYDHYVYALDGATGAKKWQYETSDLVATTPAVGANNVVYVGGYDHIVYALNASGDHQGKAKWMIHTNSAVSSPIVGPDGTVYVGADRVYAFDGDTGVQKWAFSDKFVGNDTPILDAKAGVLYVGAHDGTIYALSTAKGKERWHYATNSSIESAPLLGPDGALYVAANKLYAFRADRGSLLWTVGDGTHAWSSPALGSDNLLYAGCADQHVYAVNPANGRIRWTFTTHDSLITAPGVGPLGKVFLTSVGTGRIYALSSSNGQIQWQRDAPVLATASNIGQ